MHRIGLIVGNGLPIDLRGFLSPSLEVWDPQHPLDWQLWTPGKRDTHLLKSLPGFAKAIEEIKQMEGGFSDFDIFDRILQRLTRTPDPDFERALLEAEVRHFLAIAYSHFQLQVDSLDIEGWPWLTWIRGSKAELVGVVSFNYDLIIERALEDAGLRFHRFGVRLEDTGIPILKPHGSIDFDVEEIRMPVKYPLQNVALRNDFPLRRLDRIEFLQPRTEADIVLPNEYSPQANFQWIRPGYKWFQEIGSSLTRCIFMGLSYWECDRPEIDFLLGTLRADTELIVANPDPPPAFLNMVKERFQKVKVWRNGPE